MPLSYKLIKNHQVNITNKDFKIPTATANDFKEMTNEKPAQDIKNKEIKAKTDQFIQRAESQAKEILDAAKKNAQDIKKKAQSEGYKQGFQKGQEEGHAQGYSQALEEIQETKDQARYLLHNAHEKSREYIKKTEEEIIDLSISIAKNIIHYSVDKNHEVITEIAKNALQKAEESKQIIFRARPEYISILKNNEYDFMKICLNTSFVFLEDKEVEDKSCIIETDTQIIDLQIDKQLENIKTSLLEMREEDGF